MLRQVPSASAVARKNIDAICAVFEGVGSRSARLAFGDSVRDQMRGMAQARTTLLGLLPSGEELAAKLSDAEAVVTDLLRKAGLQIEAGAVNPADFTEFLTGLLEQLGDAMDPEVKSLLSSLNGNGNGGGPVGPHDAGTVATTPADGLPNESVSL
jgi:hypothetical protein